MAREDTNVGGDDDVEQMNHCWTEQNMAVGEDIGVGGDDDVDDLNEMWRVNSVVKVRMTSSCKL
jgi:hypothetical protein